jgi:hypothetical protein
MMTLLTQIEATMKAGGPLDAIEKMLVDFKQTITEEQVTHDNLHTRQVEECSGETDYRDKEIADAKAAIAASTETLNGCEAQQLRAVGDLAITKRALNENRSYLVLIEESRRRDAYDYETNTNALSAIIKAVEESLVILETISSGEEEFITLTKHTNAIARATSQINKVKLLGPTLAVFTQLALQSNIEFDEALLNRAKTVLNHLRDQFNEEFQNAVEAENNAIAVFTEDKARVEAIVANLEENVEELGIEISALDKCIVTQTGIVSAGVAKRDRNQQLLDDADALCGSVDTEYEEATKSRGRELKLLAALRERVEARFADISGGVRERGEEDEFSYENKSAIEHKEFHA